MMVALNSRINISNRGSGSSDDSTKSTASVSNLEVRRSLPTNASHGDMVTLEQWTTASPEAHKLRVSMAIQSYFVIDILIWETGY